MKKSKYSHLIEKVINNLGVVFRPSELKRVITDVVSEEVISSGDIDIDSTKLCNSLSKLIYSRKIQHELILHNLRFSNLLFSFRKDVEPIQIANAFTHGHGHYLGNLTAMYFLGLTDQRPKSFYICNESLPATTEPFEYSVDKVKMSFMKSHRTTQRYFEYSDHQYYFLEKQFMNGVGIIDYILKDDELGETKIPMSNIERTFLDSIISPQYSGGITQVLESFKDQKINIKELKKYYDALVPKYPYWQKIGFVLDLNTDNKSAKEWRKLFFNEEMKDFFLDKEYRSTWNYSEEWKIFYPKGIKNE
ncbi:MAG: hypothetical protein H7281_15170 [Bacteriovorax sp.]|nr:hypothetical protein [Bacteriovorax sp.]